MKVKNFKLDYTYWMVTDDDNFTYTIKEVIVKDIAYMGCSLYKIICETPDKEQLVFINTQEDSFKMYQHYIGARNYIIKELEMKKKMIDEGLEYWKNRTKY